VSENGAAYQPYVLSIEQDSVYFVGKKGNQYAFYSLARDYVGNIESKMPTAEVSTGRVAVMDIGSKDNWLGQNIPNPFTGTTTIPFYLAEPTQTVKIEVLNLTGAVIKTVVSKSLLKGEQSIVVDLKDLAAGVYFYRLDADGRIMTKKMVISR
jgi:Secretion system C-terminal sorting domain